MLAMTVTVSDTADPLVPPLLGPEELPPFSVINPDGKSKCLLVCDHASNRVPQKLGSLGLEREELEKHSSWDIGALAMTERLCALLDARAIVANYSRMVIDLNRRLDHPTLFPTSSEGVQVTGNLIMPEEDKILRIEEIYRPYHAKLAQEVDGFLSRGIVPALISVHSYNPVFFGQVRPWQLAALWAQDERLPKPFIAGMRAKGYNVGDNEPYDARIMRGATTHMHADGRRLPNLLIEYRNDYLRDAAQLETLAQDTYEVLAPALADAALYTLYDGPEQPHDLAMEYEYFERVVRTAHVKVSTGKEEDNG